MEVSHALLSLEACRRLSIPTLLRKRKEEPWDLAAFQHQEVSQMVEVQLRLSSCGVAELLVPDLPAFVGQKNGGHHGMILAYN